MKYNSVEASPETIAAAEALGIKEHPGYKGRFTRAQAPEARFPNGSRVQKSIGEAGDTHTLGSVAKVLGSLHYSKLGTAYFVEFENDPGVAFLIVEEKITWAV